MLDAIWGWLFPPQWYDLDGTRFTPGEVSDVGFDRAWEIARANAEERRYLAWWFREARRGLHPLPTIRITFFSKGG